MEHVFHTTPKGSYDEWAITARNDLHPSLALQTGVTVSRDQSYAVPDET
jgi:hypothetical protein